MVARADDRRGDDAEHRAEEERETDQRHLEAQHLAPQPRQHRARQGLRLVTERPLVAALLPRRGERQRHHVQAAQDRRTDDERS
jgi:hypothetical protein